MRSIKNVCVFFGGVSVEHDISVITGALALNSLDKEKYNPVPVYVAKNGVWYTGDELFNLDWYSKPDLKKLKIAFMKAGDGNLYTLKGAKLKKLCSVYCAINCMHGENGEDGCLAGFIKLCGVPFASPDILASSVCMNKSATKIFLKGLGVKVLPFVSVSSLGEVDDVADSLDYPVIVKPECGGSSIGVNTANTYYELQAAVSAALRLGERAVIEPCLESFTEINCAAYTSGAGEIIVSECEQPFGKSKVLSFDDKYVDGGRVFPANIDETVSSEIKETVKKIYSALDMRGVIRIDFFVTEDGVYVNEVNTVPGSLAYYLFVKSTKEFAGMLDELVAAANARFCAAQNCKRTLSTGIFNNIGSKGAKALEKKR